MEFTQLCVWPGTTLGDTTPQEFENFMKETFGVTTKFAEEVTTNPDKENGKIVPDTGGRKDLLFFVEQNDIGKFAVPRLKAGIRWWEDVVHYNKQSYLYSKEILDKYPVTW